MQTKRFQNKMAESRWALPIVLPVAVLVWVVIGLSDSAVWPCLISATASTLLMANLNNTNALIRIYSRMVSCSFIALLTMAPMLFTSHQMSGVTFFMAALLTMLFRCYQDAQSPGWVFYAFVCLGMASMNWVQALFFVPLLWVLMATPLFCLSMRSLVASLLGLALPYWFWLGYSTVMGDLTPMADHFIGIAQFAPLCDLSTVTPVQVALFAVVALSALLGGVHFMVTAYNDKIRTRMLYRFFIVLDVAAIVFLVLQPQHFAPLWGIMVIATAPLIGHFIALTRGRWSAYTTYLLMAAVAALTIYNLWPLLPNCL